MCQILTDFVMIWLIKYKNSRFATDGWKYKGKGLSRSKYMISAGRPGQIRQLVARSSWCSCFGSIYFEVNSHHWETGINDSTMTLKVLDHRNERQNLILKKVFGLSPIIFGLVNLNWNPIRYLETIKQTDLRSWIGTVLIKGKLFNLYRTEM